jgi:amylosucrase
MHRPVMPWDLADTRHDPSTDAGRMWAGLRRLIDVRKGLDSLHASAPTRVHPTSHPAVVLFVRTHPAGDMVQVYNVSDWNVTIPESDIRAHAHGLTFDRLTGREVHPHDGLYSLRPYTTWWLTNPAG